MVCLKFMTCSFFENNWLMIEILYIIIYLYNFIVHTYMLMCILNYSTHMPVQARCLLMRVATPTVCEAQSRHLCQAFPFMFYGLPNIFRKESRYFLQYLNKFPFMVIVSNSVRSNFLNKPPNKFLISTISFVLQN